jgi:predicted metal-dependent phosphoesterase TrpH
MVDLHLHTCHSDGVDDAPALLRALAAQNATLVSVTDHDNVDFYFDLKALPNAEKERLPRFVSGVELSYVQKHAMHDMLGYGIDVDKMKAWLDERYGGVDPLEKQRGALRRMKEMCDRVGLKYAPGIEVKDGHRAEAFVAMYTSLASFPENRERFPELENNSEFYRQHYCNPESPCFVDETAGMPSLQEAVDIIHACGGKAFLAHPLAYRLPPLEHAYFTGSALKAGIDGVEVWHSSNQGEDVKLILAYAERNGLKKSGGSDYHGSVKPGLLPVVGYGNMLVPRYEVDGWCAELGYFRP